MFIPYVFSCQLFIFVYLNLQTKGVGGSGMFVLAKEMMQ